MEKFLEAAAIAWNPIGEVRRRLRDGSLTVGAVLVPFVSIVVACNLFFVGAEKFFFEVALSGLQIETPAHPLIGSEYALRLLSAILVLVPAAAISLLPAGVFNPPGRNATIAAVLVVAAAWAFYGAAVGVPVYFFAGVLATVSPQLGFNVLTLLSFPMMIGIPVLTLFFWFRIMRSVLGLNGAQITAITLTALVTGALVTGFFVFVILASVS